MAVEFAICGGELRIEKKVFVREILKPQSPMKQLLNYELEDSGKKRSLKVDKTRNDVVIIDFNFTDNVSVGEDYQTLLESLKKEHRSALTGEVVLATHYYGMHIVTLDLNSHDDKIIVKSQ